MTNPPQRLHRRNPEPPGREWQRKLPRVELMIGLAATQPPDLGMAALLKFGNIFRIAGCRKLKSIRSGGCVKFRCAWSVRWE